LGFVFQKPSCQTSHVNKITETVETVSRRLSTAGDNVWYNAMSNLERFENKNGFFYHEKIALHTYVAYYIAGVVVVNSKGERLATGVR
jgi:hypothetical protein